MQQQDVDLDKRAVDTEFSLYKSEDDPLAEGVSKLQYLFRALYQTDNTWPTVYCNRG